MSLNIRIDYLDDGETTVTFLDDDSQIIEVYLRRVPPQRMEHNADLKPYDLSIFSDEKNFNVVTAPRPE